VVVAWVLQAATLRHGSLALVQAMQVLSLVFALPFGVRLTGQRITRRSAITAGVTVLGLMAFVVLGQPQGGISGPGDVGWLVAGLVTAVVTAALTWLGLRYRGPVAAAMFGTASGVCFALQAALTKLLVMEFGLGAMAIFTGWPLYVFVLAAVVGFVVQQASLKTGSLAGALATLDAATLAVSVLLALTLFREAISHGSERIPIAVFGLALAIGGVVLLSHERGRRRSERHT
jgi:drug/metabolite transporter (DMT)-like permease